MEGFTPPLILHAVSRSRLARIGDVVVTALLWAGWLYLLVAAIGALWMPPFVHRMLPVDPPSNPWGILKAVVVYAAIAGGLCATVRWRISLHRRWFAGEDRRRSLVQPDVVTMAADFNVPTEDLATWRISRRLVVYQDHGGHIVAVEQGPLHGQNAGSALGAALERFPIMLDHICTN